MEIKDKIKALRRTRGISQKELSQIIGVTKTTVSNWETGFAEPNGKALMKLSEFFDVAPDYLVGLPTAEEIPAEKIDLKVELIDRILEADEKTVDRLFKYLEVILKNEKS